MILFNCQDTTKSHHKQTRTLNDDIPSSEYLYKQIKETLDPERFNKFATNIRELNNGTQSVERTLQNIKVILGDERKYLYNQLSKLIKRASGES